MKVINSLIVICFFFLLTTSAYAGKKSTLHKESQVIRPNLADITNQYKVIKPLIETPFIPTEVDKLADTTRKIVDETPMTNAYLVGKVERSNGLDEKPSLYSTVISSHATSVSHPIPQAQHVPTTPVAAATFAAVSESHENEKLSPGAYTLPVRIEGSSITDPTLSGYETPNFIHKKENINGAKPVSNDPVVVIENSMHKDIQTFIAQFDNAHDKKERVDILINGKKKIAEESQLLTKEIESELKELLLAKETAVKLNVVLSHYTEKLHKDQLSELKLADIVTVKAMLRDKLHREIQGFRSTPSDYKELEKINPEDVEKVINQIKLKLNSS